MYNHEFPFSKALFSNLVAFREKANCIFYVEMLYLEKSYNLSNAK